MTRLEAAEAPAVLAEHVSPAAEVLKALSNPHRLAMVCRLRQGEATVGALVEHTNMSQSGVSQHLAVLRESGIVAARRDAQCVRYRLDSRLAIAILDTLDTKCGNANGAAAS